jgi:hypothetical protein
MVQKTHEVSLQQKQADKDRTLQEVFDLSINNAVQKDTADFMLSTGYKDARAAETQMNLTKSMQVLDENEHEKLEQAFGAMGDNPSKEGYSLLRDSMVKMNPILAEILPKSYGPEAMKGLQRARQAYIKTRAHRQKMDSAGFDRNTAQQLTTQKYKNDMGLLTAGATNKMRELNASINSNELLALLGDEGATKRARMAMEPMMRIGQELLEKGDPIGAMAVFDQAAKIKSDALLAKLRGTPTDPSVLDARAVKQRSDLTDSVQEGLLKNYANIGPGYDKDHKAMQASNMSTVTDNMLNKAETAQVPPGQQAGWVQERMVLDTDNNKWIEMPLDMKGNPVPLGQDASGHNIVVTSSDILSSIGHTVDTSALKAAGMHWKTTEKIDDLAEALEFYDYRLKLHGHPGIYPGGSKKQRVDQGNIPNA